MVSVMLGSRGLSGVFQTSSSLSEYLASFPSLLIQIQTFRGSLSPSFLFSCSFTFQEQGLLWLQFCGQVNIIFGYKRETW